MTKPDGEWPAFPVVSDEFGHYSGMTVRDYFAGRALPALIAKAASEGAYNFHWIADEAYALANAMLAASARLPLPESAREASGVAHG